MENSADKIMEDTIADFERRIVAIQKVKQTQGRSAAVAQYVPSCRGNDNLYCLGAYTNSLGAAMSKNGVSPRESGLMQATAAEKGSYQADKWGSPQISCPGAANYFETHKNADVKSCGKSLQDMPKGTTLGEMLIQGYKDGSIPKGSLVMVRSDGNTSGTGMHAAMFVGLNEKGEPLFSCANPERIRQPMPKWSNQVASAGKSRETDCYVINTKKALEAKVPETRQPQKTQTQAQEQKKGQQAHASVGRGGLSKGNSDKKAELGSVGRPIGFPSFSLGRKGNDNSAANGKQSQKRGRFTSGRVAEANARVGRGNLSKGAGVKKRAELGRAKFSPLSVDGVVNSLKDAAKNIADKLRETVSNIGGRREVRNEIRARAKYRCALKTTKQTRQKKAVLSKGNAHTEVKKVNLMKTLKRNSVGPSIRTSDRQSVTQRMNTSPALKKAMLAARTR